MRKLARAAAGLWPACLTPCQIDQGRHQMTFWRHFRPLAIASPRLLMFPVATLAELRDFSAITFHKGPI